MAIVYSIDPNLKRIAERSQLSSDTPRVEVFSPEEIDMIELENIEALDSLRYLSHSEGPYVNVLSDCIIGALPFPGKEVSEQNTRYFDFHLGIKQLIFIANDDMQNEILGGLDNASKQVETSTAGVLFEFMKYLIRGDLRFLDDIEDQIDDVEELIVSRSQDIDNHQLLRIRRKLLRYDRLYQQLTDMATLISKDESLILSKDERRSFRLFAQQASRLYQRAQYLKEYSLQLLELFQTQIDIQQNKTMQWLTVVATILLPLTLITSWYGMNFRSMPEIEWEYGYAVIIILCAALIVVELIIFKKRKWL